MFQTGRQMNDNFSNTTSSTPCRIYILQDSYSADYQIGYTIDALGHKLVLERISTASLRRIIRYIDHKISMSEPRIYALLAAPPFYKYKADGTPYEYGNFASMGTSWGRSEVSGGSTSNASSNSVSAIIGFPGTYPSDKSQIVSNVANSEVLWAAPFGGSEFVGIGSGVDVNRSISLDETTAVTSGFNFNVNMELVATAFGVKLGAGYGHGETNESTHIEGVGHSIAGHVSGVSNLGEYGLADYQWTVCWYKYRLGGQEFPVVNYVVKP
jgi:hypothetical protein